MQKDYHCTMKGLTPILTITGSDNTGGTGIQRDIKTITALGGHAETAITSITVQNDNGIEHIIDLSPESWLDRQEPYCTLASRRL